MMALRCAGVLFALFIMIVVIDDIAPRGNRVRELTNQACRVIMTLLAACLVAAALTACGDTINPVRYQTVEVLVTKPCFAGRTPPAPAVELTEPTCDLGRPECIRAAKADIQELQREAKQYRRIIQECSK